MNKTFRAVIGFEIYLTTKDKTKADRYFDRLKKKYVEYDFDITEQGNGYTIEVRDPESKDRHLEFERDYISELKKLVEQAMKHGLVPDGHVGYRDEIDGEASGFGQYNILNDGSWEDVPEEAVENEDEES